MKRIILSGFFILISLAVYSQEWLTNFEEAAAIAKKENRNIVMVFAGSDWCAPCIKLEKNIFESDDFKKYAAAHWVLLKLDFPKQKKNKLAPEKQAYNDALAEKFNKKGYFPFVLILDESGKVLGETSYKDISPKSYVEELIAFEK